jgi:hypothetical protein
MPRVDDSYGGDEDFFDLSPWVSSPSSSRVARFRFDHANRVTQVQWRNNIGNGYVYKDMGYEQYRQFARAISKGEKINTFLNNFDYRPMTEDEWSAPSNPLRKGLRSRLKD